MIASGTLEDKSQDPDARLSNAFYQRLVLFLSPLLEMLDVQLDKRLVRTLVLSLSAILRFRHSTHGLLLSELGGYILPPSQAPAGTKRLSNLLRSRKWTARLIETWLWQAAEARVDRLVAARETPLAIWDESVLEKPESRVLEDLCPVRSTQAERLKRIRPGFFKPPTTKPICVAGWHWLGLLIVGLSGTPKVAAMRWWTTRGERATDQRSIERALLAECTQAWGSRIRHIFDRGFAGAPWLGQLRAHKTRFVLRWPKRYNLVDAAGQTRPAWKIAIGKRAWGQAQVWDGRRHCWRTVSILALPVTHPDYPDWPLCLVISRQGGGRPPWYLLTNDPIPIFEAAYQTVRAYARRWQIELSWRYSKSELAFESPRVRGRDDRLKLLLMVTLVYAFLLMCLAEDLAEICHDLLRRWCHRTGQRCQQAQAPLYRLRSALSRLWLTYPPPVTLWPVVNSG